MTSSHIQIITTATMPTEAVQIPWVQPGDNTWRDGKPVFEVGDGTPSAAGWMAVTDDDIHILVKVKDDDHTNNQTGGDMWNGDFIRVAIDARGNGTDGAPKDTGGALGPDDATFGFALTKHGSEGWTYKAGVAKDEGVYPANLLNFTRDEAAKTTTYDIRLPWARFHVSPGVFPTLGVAVQVRDSQVGKTDPTHLRWGLGTDSLQTGLFERVAIGPPPHDIAAMSVTNTEVWNPGDAGEAACVVASSKDHTITVKAGSETAELKVPGDAGRLIRRYLVRVAPEAGNAFEARITSADGHEAARQDVSMVIPAEAETALCKRLDALLLTAAANPLFSRHLRSVKALAQSAWARATVQMAANPAAAKETYGYIKQLIGGFAGDAADWQSYLNGKRALMMAYVSPRDGTLQFYSVMLPKDWDQTQSYPMFLELHGAGNPHPLNWPAAQLAVSSEVVDLHGYETPKTYAMIERSGFHVFPYGRGNSGYRDIGETDVWEAYRDASANFKIDPDRRYLYGFSMGGGGTWRLGVRTPDLWAAIAILAPAAGPSNVGLGRNLSNLPVWIWCGEDDGLLGNAKWMRDEITKYGPAPEFSSTPHVGHNYMGEVQKKSIEWMEKFTRKRPDKFSFVADTDEHRGVWGITMKRDLAISGTPSFDCKIEGQMVTVDSKGTPELTIDLGKDGLRLDGAVTVVWNGKKVYDGPVNAADKPIVVAEE